MSMAPAVDPRNGFCRETKTFYSLRPPTPIPPPHQPLSIFQYCLSLLRSSAATSQPATTPFLVNSSSGDSLSFSQFLSQVRSLSLSLKSKFPGISPNDVAFILCPASLHVPVIYFSLLSLGVTLSPANPLSSTAEVTHLLRLSKPKLAFATSLTARKLPSSLPTVLIDSPEFLSWLTRPDPSPDTSYAATVSQSDTSAILYSSGTTGRVKGVALSHRNLIALISGFQNNKAEARAGPEPHPVSLFTLPLFHVFGFFMLIGSFAMGETLVLMERFDFEEMLRAVERYRVLYIPVSPPLIVALAKSELTRKYDLSSLMGVGCGGAPLGKEVAEKFAQKFPNVIIIQGYGLTETGGGATRMLGPEEAQRYGSAGRLSENTEARIVDPATGEALPPGQKGELWLRGPTVMKGYVGDEKATAETLDSEGWLKTGDLCYFDDDGFLYIVDRLKELIKYKAYQVPPAELEQLLMSNPQIADAAVIPYPDEEAGQIPMAYIVRKPGNNIAAAEVMEFVSKQVAPYKKIRRVAFVNSIPKSPAGKILRRELVTHAISGASSKL